MNQYLVTFTYTNYKGNVSQRRVQPTKIIFESNEYHPEPQWLLVAFDTDKRDFRKFAIRNITDWQPITPEPSDNQDTPNLESNFESNFD